ncbi:MAG: CoB--CoM heterodisulfide reductase iron-sulfur subunit B family protein [Candidatus Njordarchaeales archaeon]
MKYLYFPGCSLKNYAKRYEETAVAVAKALGIELIELKRWNCCGAVSGLAEDSVFHHIAAVRDLVRAQEQLDEADSNKLVTVCSMCYRVLASVNNRLKHNPEDLDTINEFMSPEEYNGGIEVVHLLQIIKDDIGFDRIAELTKKDLSNIKVAPYYGCVLVRPKETAIDDPNEPTILEELIKSTGATAVENPLRTECCGSYNVVTNRELVKHRISNILKPIMHENIDFLVSVCPLCTFNLEFGIKANKKELHGREIPVLYFTEFLALAFSLDDKLEKEVLQAVNI